MFRYKNFARNIICMEGLCKIHVLSEGISGVKMAVTVCILKAFNHTVNLVFVNRTSTQETRLKNRIYLETHLYKALNEN